MSLIREVVLDLDDVCNMFCMEALLHIGVVSEPLDYSDYPSEYGWDIVAAANNLLYENGRPQLTTEQFWDSMPQEFWATVRPTYYLPRLLFYLEHRVGRDNICVATSPTLSPACAAGKLAWIQCYLPTYLHRQYHITPCKERLASPGVLLIDDRRGNCEKFERRGGQALMVPMPWNQLGDFKNTYTSEGLEVGLRRVFGKKVTL